MYRIFICLIVAQCVFAEVVTNGNLRGNAASAGKKAAADAAALEAGNEVVHNQHEIIKKHENALYEVIKQIHKGGLEKGTKVAKDSVLSVPDVSYQNYMVMRQRLNKDCTGPGTIQNLIRYFWILTRKDYFLKLYLLVVL